MGEGSSQHHFEDDRCDLVKEDVEKLTCKKACKAHHVRYQQAGLPEGWGQREEGDEGLAGGNH